MCSAFPHQTADLAARLTDLALEIHAGTGTGGDSVQTELRLWHALQVELKRDLRWMRLALSQSKESLEQVWHQMARRAALQVAGDAQSAESAHGLCHV